MTTKATLRRDGIRRITLRVEVHLTLEMTAAAIAMASNAEVDEIKAAGRGKLLDWARCGVEDYGMDHVCMSDGDGYEAETEAARERLVELGVFPARQP